MKTLYFECNTGAAGDMLCASLADLFDDKSVLEKEIAQIGLPKTEIFFENKNESTICGLRCKVLCCGAEEGKNSNFVTHANNVNDVGTIVSALNLKEKVKNDILNIYSIIAKAESKVHGVEVSKVHFHELGMMDAIADITVFCFLLDKLGVDRIITSPINVGRGTVKCAHGILPVPAPATAEILKGVPYYKSKIDTELCTPTGAAVLKYFTDEFTETPTFNVSKIGIGVGSKNLSAPNILRVFLSEENGGSDKICELSCNIDDMTGEEISFACEKFFSAGALDVFTTSIYMKKNRPAVKLTVLCSVSDKDEIVKAIFQNTKTLGVRENICSRYILNRREKIVNTPYGEISVKYSDGFGTENFKIEYESIKKVANENNISFSKAESLLEKYLS
ncbi:MAG: nickel pincer cofactor biosynthesis protein LarC [Eubacteriales bacterium]|nr:nickel pincer cofactor biosynthesis protein LarC [Eubacteriales bacterium]